MCAAYHKASSGESVGDLTGFNYWVGHVKTLADHSDNIRK